MSPKKSPWWRAFDKVERKIGKPLEDAVASPRYVDVMTRGLKLQRALGGTVGRVAGGALERALHVAHVSTQGDVRRLTREVAMLTSEVRRLKTEQQQAAEAAKPGPAPRTTPRKPPREPKGGA